MCDPEIPNVSIRDLVHERPLLLTEDNVTRVELDLAVTRAGLEYGVAHECSVGHAVQALAAAGHGVAVVTDLPRFGLKSLFITDASSQRLSVRMHAAWQRDHYARDTIQDLVDRMSQFLQQQAGY